MFFAVASQFLLQFIDHFGCAPCLCLALAAVVIFRPVARDFLRLIGVRQ